MKRLFTFVALCVPIYLFAQGFGSFTHDQPYFAIDRSGEVVPPCDLGAWNPASNSTTYALYDFNCLTTLNDGDLITSLTDYGPFSITLNTTNPPYCTNNVLELNNRKYGVFVNKYLQGADTHEYIQPTTIFIVARQLTNAGVGTLFDNGNNNIQPGGFFQNMFELTGGVYTYGGVSGGEIQAGPYNTPTNWTVTEVYWNGASSYVKTNGSTALSATFGQGRRRGVSLAADCNFGQRGDVRIAWAGFFTNTLDATTSSNIFFYLTNRFSIPQS